MLAERHIIERNDYASSDRGTPLDVVEQVKAERGFIDLDDPEQRRKFTSSGAIPFNPKIEGDRKAGIKRSRIEHEQALDNLSTGKATLRRDDGQPKRRKKGAGRPKVRTEMSTQKGQQVLDKIKEDGFYDVDNFELSQTYLSNIIFEIRELGYKVSNIKGKNQRVVCYKLDKQ